MNRRVPNSILLKMFFETKSDEIVDVFSSGPDFILPILDTGRAHLLVIPINGIILDNSIF